RARTDEGGRQAGAHGIDAASVETAGGCVGLRRDTQRLEGCPAVRELLNEIFRLERIERRVREGKGVSPAEDTQRPGRVTQFRKLRDELWEAAQEAVALEDEALLALHSQEVLDHERLRQSLAEGRQRFNRVLRSLFVMRFDRPDEVTVAVFSEVPALLVKLTAAYAEVAWSLGVAVDLWQFLPGREGRDEKSTPERRLVLEAVSAFTDAQTLRVRRWDRARRTWAGPEAWASAWEGVIGTALAIRGPAVNPLFAPETGLHQFNAARDAGKCLVDTSPLPMIGTLDNTFYLPPAGTERRRAIGSQGRRRIYHPERNTVEDLLLGRKITWNGDLKELLADLLEQRLTESARGLLAE